MYVTNQIPLIFIQGILADSKFLKSLRPFEDSQIADDWIFNIRVAKNWSRLKKDFIFLLILFLFEISTEPIRPGILLNTFQESLASRGNILLQKTFKSSSLIFLKMVCSLGSKSLAVCFCSFIIGGVQLPISQASGVMLLVWELFRQCKLI